MRISIISVVWNDLSGLKRTYQSLEPYLNDFEWVIIDGGSKDGTKQWLSELNTNINNIHWISEPDKGMYDAMNKGIELAKGDHLLFLNAGDYLNSDKLSSLIKSEFPLKDINVFGIMPVDANLEAVKWRGFVDTANTLEVRPCIPHQSTIIRKDTMLSLGKYDTSYRYLGDYDFFCKAYSKGISYHFYPEHVISIFVQDGVSSSFKHAKRLHEEIIVVQKKYFGKANTGYYLQGMIKTSFQYIPFGQKIFDLTRKIFLNK